MKPKGKSSSNRTRARRVHGKVPLVRALSKLGLASRTRAEEWVTQGRLGVDGEIRTNPRFLVTPETSKFTLDGKPLRPGLRRTFLLHKPKGLVTTRADEKGRPTVF